VIYIVGEFGIESSGGFDFMSITHGPLICVWHLLKYSLRIWNNNMEEHDLEKIAHYAKLAWTMSGGGVVRNQMVGEHQIGEGGFF